MPDDEDVESMWEAMQNEMMEALQAKDPRMSLENAIEKASKLEGYFNLHFRDHEGYSLLGRAVKLHLMDIIRFLVEEKMYKIKEELVIAVEIDYKECVDYFIKRKPELVSRKVLAGTVCRPGMTPVMMASLTENESMLQFLFARGAKPLQIPVYDPRETSNIIRFDSIYRTLLAISKPMYLCVMNEDPVMVAFKIAETCEKIAASQGVAKDEVLEIKQKCEQFAADFIKYTSTFDDLELILSQMTTKDLDLVAPGNPLERLNYAMINNHKDFVSNGSVQKLMKRKFYNGPLALNDFDGANILTKSLYITALVLLTPVWLFLYLVFPASDSATGKFVKSWMEMPFMRFVVNFTIYVCVVFLIVESSVNLEIFPMDKWPVIAAEWKCSIEYSTLDRFDCIENNIAYTSEQKELFKDFRSYQEYIWREGESLYTRTFTNSSSRYAADGVVLLWIFGNTYREFVTIWTDGFSDYTSDWVNCLSILLNLCFICAVSLRYSFIAAKGYIPTQLFGDEAYHALQVSNALRSVGLLLLFYRMYKMLRVTQAIGRQQVMLIEALKAGIGIVLMFMCLALAFSVSTNGILRHTYKAYIQNCLQNPDGTYSPQHFINIPCPTNLVPSSLSELIRYQDYIHVYATFFFGMFQSSAYILDIFPSYENAQEWAGTALFSLFTFLSKIIQMNLITCLIILSIMSAARRQEIQFKFSRAQVMYLFMQGGDPLPSPFNLIPSIYRITAWRNAKREAKGKMFSEAELRNVPKMRDLIRTLKLTYMREAKISLFKKQIGANQIEQLRDEVKARIGSINSSVRSVHRRTKDYEDGISAKQEGANHYTEKFEATRTRGIFNAGISSKLASFFR
ncbi:short transient receptor potential channel 4-like [Convolutriloba macropyga]|uniref:short transient receptor potential channel 4-like n=1 Tax=Convolutriloba macropyga TaxID=536237 RepID=UPI003F51E34F